MTSPSTPVASLTHTEKIKVLVVDDEPDILEFIQYNLRKEGYQTYTASDGIRAIELARRIIPDVILLDIMMPGSDGVTTCHELRRDDTFNNTLIAFLTARSEEYSEIAGLNAGADDYISKPIRPRLLLSRIRALLRRRKQFSETNHDGFNVVGPLGINRETYQFFKNDHEINLTKTEFELMQLFMSNPGRVFTRQDLFQKIWGYAESINSRTIEMHICKLREKIGSGMIKTIIGVGYSLNAFESTILPPASA